MQGLSGLSGLSGIVASATVSPGEEPEPGSSDGPMLDFSPNPDTNSMYIPVIL